MKTRTFLKLMASVTALLVLALPAVAQGQPPNRVDVLVGFVSPPTPEDVAIVQAIGGQVRYVYSIVPAMAASVPEPALRGLAQDRRVRVIEPDGLFHATNDGDFQGELDRTWGVKRIQSGVVHQAGLLGGKVRVAVLDTGIDASHPEFAGIYKGGYNFVAGNHQPVDGHGHGTHVAGTVAAARDGVGVVGVAPGIDLYALKVLGDDGSGSFSDVIAALQWCIQNNIHISNNSYGSGGDPGTLVKAAFDNSYTAGVLHVAAAGNSGGSGPPWARAVNYPARWDSLIAVAATTQDDKRASFSSYGPEVELAAPGVSIPSTIPGGGYASYSGTSMASPHVAGVAALIRAADGSLLNTEVRAILHDTAQNLGLDANHQGHGLVRADLAVAAAVNVESPITFTITANAGTGGSITPSGAVTVNQGADQSFTITPESGYQIADVVVDEISVGPVSSYTFENVTGDHSIDASFFKTAEAAPLSITQFDVTDNSNPAWARASVVWAVSGSNLTTVKSELRLNGVVVASQTSTVSGQSASGQHELSARRSQGTYSVKLTVSDGNVEVSDVTDL
jgi:subtilisin family serine protease